MRDSDAGRISTGVVYFEIPWHRPVFKLPGEDVCAGSSCLYSAHPESSIAVFVEIAGPLPAGSFHARHDRAISIYLLPEAISRIALVILVGHQTIIDER